MPELPEVETIRRGLANELVGHTIQGIEIRAAKLFAGEPHQLIGQKVLAITRRAKIMIWQLERSYLLIHLKMTGQLIFIPSNKKYHVVGGHPDKNYTLDLPHKHSHIIFEFDHGILYYNDLRKFGWIRIVESFEEIQPHVAALGPEYNWPEFTLEYFSLRLKKMPNLTIKQALLDQRVVAGLGNIYADETLFCAKVLPTRQIKSLHLKEITAIFKCIPLVLNKALEHGGTTIKDFRHSDGSLGSYLVVANVYKREGKPCKICATPIQRRKIAGRSSHFCPHCQK